MSKLSVYVPDDLLSQARAADPELNPSKALQDALRARLVDRRARPYAHLSDDLERQREAAERLVLDRVTEAYGHGYAIGLFAAQSLPWDAFEDFRSVGWDVRTWAQDFDDHEYAIANPTEEERDQALVLGWRGLLEAAWDQLTIIPTDTDAIPVGVPAEGFVDAVRDVWEGARALRDGERDAAGAEPGEGEATS
jgi:hypothetical protein